MSSYLDSPYSSGYQMDDDLDDECRDYYDDADLGQESDEDTEDASETDLHRLEDEEYNEPVEIKEQMYLDKLAALKKQLQQLEDGTNSEYIKIYKRLRNSYNERLKVNSVRRDHALHVTEQSFINDRKAAGREFEEKKIELKENLISDLEEKKRLIEIERNSMELTGDSMDIKPVTTRKLRRRPNDPVPVPEKRRKPSPAHINYLLDEHLIDEDVKIINQAKMLTQVKKPGANVASTSYANSLALAESAVNEVKIEDGKLFYEKRWFHRGQQVFVESKDSTKFSGIIAGIGNDLISVRKLGDTSKIRIYLSQLQKGKFSIKRRAS